MSEELSIVKGKWEVKSKKAVSKKKQLDMEFEKEVFWGGTRAHMIEGIKYQYEKLKKCKYYYHTQSINSKPSCSTN